MSNEQKFAKVEEIEKNNELVMKDALNIIDYIKKINTVISEFKADGDFEKLERNLLELERAEPKTEILIL